MKKALVFLLVLVVPGFSVRAQSIAAHGHRLTIGVSNGLLAGEAEEIVYRDSRHDTKLSQLLWDMKPLVYGGLNASYSWRKPGIFAGASFKYGLPDKTGVMEDRDWTASNYPDWLTHYSVHDNKTKEAMLFDANIGVSFRVFENYLLKTYITYSYMQFSWAASGGSLLYPAADVNNDGHLDQQHGYFYNSAGVVTYKQTWHIISPAIAFYGEFNRYFDIEISLKLSPLLWLSAIDNHLMRDPVMVITEELSFGLFVEPALLFSFKPNNFFTLSLSAAYRNISGIRGDSVYTNARDENGVILPRYTYKNGAGAGWSVFDIGIMAKFAVIK